MPNAIHPHTWETVKQFGRSVFQICILKGSLTYGVGSTNNNSLTPQHSGFLHNNTLFLSLFATSQTINFLVERL